MSSKRYAPLNVELAPSRPLAALLILGIVLDDLMALMNSGYLSGATLDVFPEEPLPQDHPLWDQERVIITPHSAAITRPDTAAEYVLRNIARIEAGEQPENLLDLTLGY